VPLLRGRLRSAWACWPCRSPGSWPACSPRADGAFGQFELARHDARALLRVDRWSLVFGYIFLIAAFLGVDLRAARPRTPCSTSRP
jgi:hypothetical protein